MTPEADIPKSDVHRRLGGDYHTICGKLGLTGAERDVLDKIYQRSDAAGLNADDKTLIFLEELRDGLTTNPSVRKDLLIQAYSNLNQEYADRNPLNPHGRRGRQAKNN
ncbi:hypothetical protein HY345_01275 [Candidatus Microgenomates bacterium]|nr:hypothetical protein [Candidatus Microgenomates bacterium]